MINGFNGQIACEPIVKNTVEAEVKGGFATVKNKAELIKLKVVFGCKDGPSAGNTIFILGDQVNLPWATTIFDVDGSKVILVPLTAVRLVDSNG